MPLKDFFNEQIDQLRDFFNSSALSARAVQIGPDIKPMLLKLLVKLDGQPDNAHVLQFTTTPFREEAQYFRELLAEVVGQNEPFRDELARRNVQMPRPDEDARLSARHRFKRYVADVADALDELIGSYVLIIDPEEIADPAGFKQSLEYVAALTRTIWVKYLLLDRLDEPILHDLPRQTERGSIQRFHLPPDEIEKKVNADLASGQLNKAERRQYLAMAAAFAAAHRRYDEAEPQQREVVAQADQDGAPADRANARYNLGNTLLAQDKLDEALGQYSAASTICLEHELNPLLAMVLCNMGVALHRLRHADGALECFDVARRTFAALDNPCGEAFALDCRANVLGLEDRREEAEAAWREALARYDGINNPAMDEVKQGGRRDLVDKLKRFFEATNQGEKARQLEQAEVEVG